MAELNILAMKYLYKYAPGLTTKILLSMTVLGIIAWSLNPNICCPKTNQFSEIYLTTAIENQAVSDDGSDDCQTNHTNDLPVPAGCNSNMVHSSSNGLSRNLPLLSKCNSQLGHTLAAGEAQSQFTVYLNLLNVTQNGSWRMAPLSDITKPNPTTVSAIERPPIIAKT